MSERQSFPPNSTNPYNEDDLRMVKAGWLAAHITPQATIIIQKVLLGLCLIWMIYREVVVSMLSRAASTNRVQVVRVDDVGNAVPVTIKTDWTPDELSVTRDLEQLVERMFERKQDTFAENRQMVPAFLSGEARDRWVRSAEADTDKVAGGEGLQRIRIISGTRFERFDDAKGKGAIAHIRYAIDPLGKDGAVDRANVQGNEIVFKFRIGIYPPSSEAKKRENFVHWNPLGVSIHEISIAEYRGPDVPIPTDPGLGGVTTTVPIQSKAPKFAGAEPTPTTTPITK